MNPRTRTLAVLASAVVAGAMLCETSARATDGLIQGFVGSPGFVKGTDGKPIWAEYPLVEAPPGSKNFIPGSMQELTVAIPDGSLVISGADFKSAHDRLLALGSDGEAIKKDQYAALPGARALQGTTTWVVVRKSAPIESRLVLEAQFNPSAATVPGRSGNLDPTTAMTLIASPAGDLVYGSLGLLGYETDYMHRGANPPASAFGSCGGDDAQRALVYDDGNGNKKSVTVYDPRFRFENCSVSKVNTILEPIAGAEVDTDARWMIGAPAEPPTGADIQSVGDLRGSTYYKPAYGTLTNGKGLYDLPYSYAPYLQFTANVWAILRYRPFDSTGFAGNYYAYRPPVRVGATIQVTNTYTGSDFTQNSNIGSGPMNTGLSVDATFTDVRTPREANIAVPVAFLQGSAQFVNVAPVDSSALLSKDVVTPRINEEGQTLYTYAKANFGAPPPPVPDGGVPDDVDDDQHHGLLSEISRVDLQNTDLYVFSPAGDMLFERQGLVVNETAGLKCSNDSNGHPSCTLDPDGDPPFPARFLPQAVIPFRTTVSDVKVVLVNRATGYIGTGKGALNFDPLGTSAQTGVVANAGSPATAGLLRLGFKEEIKLRPPNLKVRVERAAKDRKTPYLIGSEGSGLVSDTSVIVYTDWYDWDGAALPEKLPGYTARVAHAVPVSGAAQGSPTSKLAPTDLVDTGTFDVKPGTQTQVLKLPDGDRATLGHYYVQIDGGHKLPQFQGNFDLPSASGGLLAYRPRVYVPFLTPRLDQKATTAARSLAKSQGLPDPAAVYKWVYRPEMQFSLFDLSARLDEPDPIPDVDLTTNANEPLGVSEVRDLFRYGIMPAAVSMIEQTGGPRELVFNIGGKEYTAIVDQSGNHQIEFTDPHALDNVSSADFLTISLYQKNDSENVLWFRDKPDIVIRSEKSKVNVTQGDRLRLTAETVPADMRLEWTVSSKIAGVHAHPEVDRNLDPLGHQAMLVPDEGSASGWATVRAADSDRTTLYSEKEIFIGCLACQAGRVAKLELHSVDVSFGLGAAGDGQAAGALFLKSTGPSTDLWKPKGLQAEAWAADTETIARDDAPRQLAAPNSFTDVVPGGDSSYEVRLYEASAKGDKDDSTGLYKIAAGSQPAVSWKIENPDPANPDGKHVQITETRGGHPIVTKYDWSDANNGWTLTKGNGLTEAEQVFELGAGQTRIETITTRKPGQTPTSIRKTTHATFSWGEGVTRVVTNESGDPVFTNTTYYTDASHPESAGKVQRIENSDGSWTEVFYDAMGRKSAEHRPWLDAASGGGGTDQIVTYYTYDPVDGRDRPTPRNQGEPRDVRVAKGSQTISHTFYAYVTDGQGNYTQYVQRAARAGASYDDATNEKTETSFLSPEAPLAGSGEVSKRVLPDGRVDTISYEFGTVQGSAFSAGTGTAVRRTTVHGAVGHEAGVESKTTKEILVKDPSGNAVYEETDAYSGGGYVPIGSVKRTFDTDGHVTRTEQSNGLVSTASWDCCLATTRTDELGRTSIVTPDDLKRPQTVTTPDGPNGSMTVSYTYDAEGRVLTETVTAGGRTQTTTNVYDGAGRLTSQTTPDNLTTTWVFTNGGRTVTVTHPGSRTEVTDHFADGRVKSITGTAVIPRYFSYDVDSSGNQITVVRIGSAASQRYERTTTDPLGRTISVERPGAQGVETMLESYDARGLLSATSRPGLADEIYEYDELGNRIRQGIDSDGDHQLALSSERASEQATTFVSVSGDWWLQTERRVYAKDGDSTPKKTSTERNRLTGFAGGVTSETVAVDIDGNVTSSKTTVDRGTKTVRRTAHVPGVATDPVETSTNGFVTARDTASGLHFDIGRDGFGRATGITDPRTGTTSTVYDDAGRVQSVTTPDSAQTTYGYDSLGRQNLVTNANGKTVRVDYNDRDQVLHRWGTAAHPVEFGYDPFGALETQTTYRADGTFGGGAWPGATGGSQTTWHRDAATGLLQSKEDPSNRSVTFTYEAGGRIKTRTNARGVTATYGYDPKTGDLKTVDYSDSTTDLTFTYDRLGRPLAASDATGSRTFEYDEALRVKAETLSGGHVITPQYATTGVVGRAAGVKLDSSYDVSYGYDAAGRLDTLSWTVDSQSDTAHYGYRTDSDLLDHVSTTNGPSAQYGYDPKRDLRTKVENLFSGATVSKYEPAYDALGRVQSLVTQGSALEQAAGAHWIFSYDDRNELTSAQHYIGTDPTSLAQPLSQDARTFDYDASGNRLTETEGAVPLTYTPNPLDQYTSKSGGGSTETFHHDPDGNLDQLTKDGQETDYTYDAEDRLTKVQPKTPVEGDLRADFRYDYRGRRISKISYESHGGAWVQRESTEFIWDGWNLLSESKTPASGPGTTCKYVWGLDVSQSVYGAGGIGGLVASVKGGVSRYYSYDANGNVGQITENGAVVGKYEYDAYGKITAKSGSAADENPWRYSTKYFDAESGFYYYGYRYYSAETGRWTSRDPAQDGTNLYGFVGNSPGNGVDALGLKVARWRDRGEGLQLEWDLEDWEQQVLDMATALARKIDRDSSSQCVSRNDREDLVRVRDDLLRQARQIEGFVPNESVAEGTMRSFYDLVVEDIADDSTASQDDLENGDWLRDVLATAREGAAGFFHGALEGILPGSVPIDSLLPQQGSLAEQTGKALGQIFGGTLQAYLGETLFAGGATLTLGSGGLAAVAGVPAMALGAGAVASGGVNTAKGIDALARLYRKTKASSCERPEQLHHFATNKSKKYTARLEKIAKRFGLDLDEWWNKEYLPHQGRHPDAYHEFVADGMERAAKEAGADRDKFLQLFEKYVKTPIRNNPDLLRRAGWD